MRDQTHGHCERCEVQVEVAYDDAELRRWAKGYMCIGLPFIPLSPIIGADFAIMLPMAMVYLLGFGPALGIIREPPKCEECGAAVSPEASPAAASEPSSEL